MQVGRDAWLATMRSESALLGHLVERADMLCYVQQWGARADQRRAQSD